MARSGQDVNVLSSGIKFQALITRPANVTAYTAGDVVGGVIVLPGQSPQGSDVVIVSCDLRYDTAALPAGIAGFRLYLYGQTPVSALADNAVWDLPSTDRAAFLGYVDLGSLTDLGSTLFVQIDGVNKQMQLDLLDSALYGYLVTLGGFTPAANSETLRLVVNAVVV